MKKNYAIERNYTETGKALAIFRERAGLSQKEVSVILSYSSAQFISNFERGIAAPPLKNLKKLTEIYGISPVSIFNTYMREEKIKCQRAMGI